MRLTVRLLTAAVVLAASTLAAHADTYQYTITISGPNPGSPADTVVFDESTLLQQPTEIADLNFKSSTNSSIAEVEINPVLGFCEDVTESNKGSCVEFVFLDGSDHGEAEAYVPQLTSTGTFEFGLGPDEVVITDTSLLGSPSPVPEPSTFALLGTGLIGAAGALRRKLFLS